MEIPMEVPCGCLALGPCLSFLVFQRWKHVSTHIFSIENEKVFSHVEFFLITGSFLSSCA